MNALLWLPRALWKMYFLSLFCLNLILFYPFFYLALRKKTWFKYAFYLKRAFVFVVCTLVGVFPIIKMKGPLPKSPYIICPNHSSYIDIFMMYIIFPRYFSMMGKKELESWPLFNIFFIRKMDISVARNSTSGVKEAMSQASEILDLGIPIVIFPEATIPHTVPKMKVFKNGAFKLAVEKQVPIVPVTFLNNWKLLQGTKLLKGNARPGFSRIVVHKAIYPSEMRNDNDVLSIKNKVYEAIQNPLIKLYDLN